MAVVSENFTLMSAGYFLSPEAREVPLNLLEKKKKYLRGFEHRPSSGSEGTSGMNLEKTLLPIMGLETKQE